MRRVTTRAFPADPVLTLAADLGAFIRAARTQSGMTLEDASLSVGVAKQTMQNIETNPASVSFGVVLDVARALGVSLFAFPAQQQEQVRRLVRTELPPLS
jgi:transcriptional regulator with XRE-family HTH domain